MSNKFVNVSYDRNTFTIVCHFLQQKNTTNGTINTCNVTIAIGYEQCELIQERRILTGINSSHIVSIKVSDVYSSVTLCMNFTASNGTSTAFIVGSIIGKCTYITMN